ncbi:MAG: SufS family cysteine desulfurase [Phycisphaerae bacterium]
MSTAETMPNTSEPSTSDARLDVERIREDFPILRQTIHGKPLVYLDNAATTQKPRAVIDAVRRYYESDNANVHRGVHQLSIRATDAYERARGVVRRYIGAARVEEIVFVRGTTEAVNLVAQTYGRSRIGAGDEIVISAMEHHSNIVPWQILCEQTGARLRVAPINDDGELMLDAYEDLLGARTKLVAVTHLSNALGSVNPVREIIGAAHRRDIPVLVDGAQAASHLMLDVGELGCDFYTLSGHKMYGPTGIGVLYARYDLLDSLPPYHGGGEMIKSVSFEKTVYNDLPHRFEAGTPNVAGAVGLAAAMEYLGTVGQDAIFAHEHHLLAYAKQALRSLPGVRFVGQAKHQAAAVSFLVDGVHPHDVGTILDQQGVAVRTGHHCAQPVMDRFGVEATTRASFALYNTTADVDALVAALGKVREVFA